MKGNSSEEFIPTRLSLLNRLRDRADQESWSVFCDTYSEMIYHAAVREGLNHAEAQDVVQETILAAMKSLAVSAYHPELGSFKKWLLRQTRWRIADQFRKRQPRTERPTTDTSGSPRTATVERVADPAGSPLEREWDAEWERNLLEASLRRLRSKVEEADYQVFDLCAIKGWPGAKVAKALGKNRATVYFITHRLRRLLRAEIERLKKSPI